MLKVFLIWIIAIALSVTSGVTALGAIAKNKSPQVAASLTPKNGFAVEAVAMGLVKKSIADNGELPSNLDKSWTELALQSFIFEPTTPNAIAVLALSQKDSVRRDLTERAFGLSRREQFVNGLLVNDSGLREDIPDMLNYYDTMLRTSSSANEIILPVIANALTNDNFVKPLGALLSREPIWAQSFWRQVVQNRSALNNASKLRKLMEENQGSRDVYNDLQLIKALVNDGQLEEAHSLYGTLNVQKQSVAGLIRNSNFNLESEYPPFDWQLFSTGEYGAVIGESSMSLSAINSAGGLMARQLVRLPADILTLKVEMIAEVPTGASVHVEFSCADRLRSDSRTIKVPLSGKFSRQKIDNRQGSCSYFWINIFGRSSDDLDGFDTMVTKFEITSTQS